MKAELLEALQRTPKLPELQSDHDLIFNPTDYTEWYDKDDVVNFADEWEEFATVLREAVQELAWGLRFFWHKNEDEVKERWEEAYALAHAIVEAAKETTDGRES